MTAPTVPSLPALPEPVAHMHSGGDVCADRMPEPPVFWPVDLFARAQVLSIRLDAMRAALEWAAQKADQKAENIRRSNTYRGKVNQTAGFAADMVDDCAAAIRAAIKESGNG